MLFQSSARASVSQLFKMWQSSFYFKQVRKQGSDIGCVFFFWPGGKKEHSAVLSPLRISRFMPLVQCICGGEARLESPSSAHVGMKELYSRPETPAQ